MAPAVRAWVQAVLLRRCVAMKPLRPSVKVAIVLAGLVVALGAAALAVFFRQQLTQGPEADASSGMYAFGDLLLGIAVFGAVALVPLALGLFWLRAVPRFWTVLAWGALAYAATGPLALVVSGWLRPETGLASLLADARVGSMPLSAFAWFVCAAFAPATRPRWWLAGAGLADGIIFAGVVVVKFLVPAITS